MSSGIPVLQIVHGTNSPFLELAGLYARALTDVGCRVTTVFLCDADTEMARKTAASEDVHFLNLPASALSGLKGRAVAPVAELCRERDFALIVAHRYKPLFVAWRVARHLSQPRILGVMHALGVMAPQVRRRLFRWQRRKTWLAGVSQAVADDLRADLGTVADERVLALANAVDVGRLQKQLWPRAVVRKVLDVPDDAFVFANVGRLHPDKDQTALLEAFAQAVDTMPKAVLLLFGEGRLHENLQQRIQVLNLQQRVKLMGRVDQAARLFAAFDAYVSTSDREPFGIVLNEAQTAAVPIIAADCGGAAEVVADSGWLYSRQEPQQLAVLMQRLHDLPEAERQALGERGRERLKAVFSPPAFHQRLQALPPVAEVLMMNTKDGES